MKLDDELISDFQKKLDKLMKNVNEIVLKNVTIESGELEIEIPAGAGGVPPQTLQMMQAVMPTLRQIAWKQVKFANPAESYPGQITEVKFIRSNRKTVTIGGENVPPYYRFEGNNPNPPVVTADVFDIPVNTKKRESFLRLAKPVKDHLLQPDDVTEDMAAWAKKTVEVFGAEMITCHFIGTDPTIPEKLGGKKSAKWTAKNLEEVMQAVDVPIIIGGSGNHEMDPKVFEACGEVAEAERFMLSSLELATVEKILPIAKKYDHNILAWTQLELNDQKKLNQTIIEMGLPKDHIVIDPTCATLGYGLEYSFSIYERIRLAGLKGEEALQCPMSGGTTNAWGAREAFSSDKKRPEWGPRVYRGPFWEIITAYVLSLCGLDIAMMLHPGAQMGFKSIVKALTTKDKGPTVNLLDWITMEV
ncbi:MAG: CO dehydrogenase/acetyl-CoA synthase subunit delta [Candidatus Helarchaeota archaeon]|nr:CO dehydrogenase/acetyl-CoA synthase subunit delta [Candidatus Helarchaeota archaeon]